jgi:hypothetical protein
LPAKVLTNIRAAAGLLQLVGDQPDLIEHAHCTIPPPLWASSLRTSTPRPQLPDPQQLEGLRTYPTIGPWPQTMKWKPWGHS